jgi:hypothetical protein
MTNKRLNAKLRRIEHILESVDAPQTCSADFFGDLRTISPTAKTRELGNLIQELAVCQHLVKDENDQAWFDGVKETLKARVNLVLNPPELNV